MNLDEKTEFHFINEITLKYLGLTQCVDKINFIRDVKGCLRVAQSYPNPSPFNIRALKLIYYLIKSMSSSCLRKGKQADYRLMKQ